MTDSGHENSELYRLEPGNVGNSTLIEHEASDEEEDETHSEEYISINDAREEAIVVAGLVIAAT